MLYVKAKDFAEAFEIVGKPAIAERKFDGFRMQIHGDGKEVKLTQEGLMMSQGNSPMLLSA